MLSPLEWRLSNYLTFILNVNFENVLDYFNHHYRENKETIFRNNFKIQYRKIMNVIGSAYDLNGAMLSVGNIDTESMLGEGMSLIGPKLKWYLIFNKLLKVSLMPGYMRITVKDEQKEYVKNITNRINEGKIKHNPFNLRDKSKSRYKFNYKSKVSPHFQQIRSYSTSKNINLFKFQGEKEFFGKITQYKYQKDLEKAQYDMEINFCNSMLEYHKDRSNVAKDLTHQTDSVLSKVLEKINIHKMDKGQANIT